MKKLEAINKIKELLEQQKKITEDIEACVKIAVRGDIEPSAKTAVLEADGDACIIKKPTQISFSEFGELLKNARKKSGLTQDEVAQKLERSRNYISIMERGSARLVKNILSYIGVLNYEIWINIDSLDLPFNSLEVFQNRVLKIALERKPMSVLCAEIGCTEVYLKLLASKPKNFGLEIFLKTIGCVGGTITIKPKSVNEEIRSVIRISANTRAQHLRD